MIDKPAGLVVHPAPGHAAGTLVNALIRHCGTSLSGIGGVKRPGIVHRLDKDTSGLLVAAKTDAAHQGLAELFADHGRTGSLEREYLALVWGGFDAPAGKVAAPIGRHPRHREKMAVVERGARPARHDPLAARGGPRPGKPHRLPARDRADPSDPRPHGVDRSSAARRFGLWSRVQDQGGAARRARQGRARRSRTSGFARLAYWASSIPSPARRSASKALRRKILSRLLKALRAARATLDGCFAGRSAAETISCPLPNIAYRRGPFSATLARPQYVQSGHSADGDG